MQRSLRLRPIVSLLMGLAFLLSGAGLQFTLLPLRGRAEDFGDFALGAIGSAYYVGFVSGCLLAPYLILRAGHIRAFTAMVAVAAAAALAYALAPAVPAWVVFRIISGLCIAGLYLVVESWLNDHATNETRGRVLSTYVVVNYVALTFGQALVTLYPIDQAGNFMVAAMLTSLAIVPVALTRSVQPAPITIVSFRPGQLFRAAPVAMVASFMIGVANGSFWSLAPLSVAGSGLSVDQVALFMSTAVLAGAIVQWPVGRLSDRVDRRRVLLVLLIGAAAAGVVPWLISASGMTLLLFGILFGALALPGYSLAAAHAYDKTPASDVVPIAATVLLTNGLGSVVGPLIASGFMSVEGPRGLFLFTALAQALLAVYVFHRVRVQASLATPEKTEFDLASSALVGGVVTPDAPDPSDPSVVVPETDAPVAATGGAAPASMR
ncbi:MFS transporter [Bradyrhizobium sp. LHD-71]|uniref:MFS transporter n=1 Tax=Bradyrhizobium sp. LHD-71 TaxID=3072141 RepID=UPI00280DCC0A|nr:MFS transporter [Bradyrhizobium sp. LHD-71]MDQ8730224.1 MFS transporter [Bradyrhizobium sp. LHD-71]